MSRRLSVGAILGLVLLARSGVGHALSLRNSAAEAFMGDFAPGSSADYSQATGSRLHLDNVGSETVRADFKVVFPSAGELKDGYESWPSPGRIRLVPTSADIRPGEAAPFDLFVTIPNDSSLVGSQYQFDVLQTASDVTGASLTVKTRVLFSVGAPLAEPGDFSPTERWDAVGYTLKPSAGTLERVPMSRDGQPSLWTTVKILNAGDEDLTVSLRPARSWNQIKVDPAYQTPGPNPRWLAFDPQVIKVPAGSIVLAHVGVAVPRQRRYASKRWTFVAAVDAASGSRRARRYFALHVSTRDWQEESK